MDIVYDCSRSGMYDHPSCRPLMPEYSIAYDLCHTVMPEADSLWTRQSSDETRLYRGWCTPCLILSMCQKYSIL